MMNGGGIPFYINFPISSESDGAETETFKSVTSVLG